MENDVATAALHMGIFENGIAEVHFDAFNPLFVNGAPLSELVRIPLVGPTIIACSDCTGDGSSLSTVLRSGLPRTSITCCARRFQFRFSNRRW